MNWSHFWCFLTLQLVWLNPFVGPIAVAQMVEATAVSVPLGVDVQLSGAYSSYEDENNVTQYVIAGYTASVSTVANLTGAVSEENVVQRMPNAVWNLIPGKEYVVNINVNDAKSFTLQFSPPSGYRFLMAEGAGSSNPVYKANTRYTWSLQDGSYDTRSATYTFKIVNDSGMGLGQCSSLRPGRLVWTIGLGQLPNGRTAGDVALRSVEVTDNLYTPKALYCTSTDALVTTSYNANGLRRVDAPHCIVDVRLDASPSAYLIKFYLKSQCAYGSVVDGLPDVIGTPYCEYKVEKPAGYPTTTRALRLTKTFREGSSSRSLWTEMRIDNYPSSSWTVYEWHEKAASATSPATSPIVATSLTQSIAYNRYTDSLTVSASLPVPNSFSTVKTYTAYPLTGYELTSESTDMGTSSFGYANKRIESIVKLDGNWVKNEYSSAFDDEGQVVKSYKPFMDAPATVAGANAANGEYTTYEYSEDWTLRKTLPLNIITNVNGILAAKTTYSYAPENYSDNAWNYGSGSNLQTLHKTTKNEYTSASGFLTTITKTFRGDTDPGRNFFPGLFHSEQRPDGSMTVMLYFWGTFDAATGTYTASTSGPDLLKLALTGTSASGTGVFAYTSHSENGISLATDAAFHLVEGKSTAEGTIVGPDGKILCKYQKVYAVGTPLNTLTLVQRDVYYYSGLNLTDIWRDSGNYAARWQTLHNSWELGRIKSSSDEAMQSLSFVYDSCDRIQTKTVKAPGAGAEYVPDQIFSYQYDALNRPIWETRGTGADSLTTKQLFNSVGKPVSVTKPGYDTLNTSATQSALTTSFGYNFLTRQYITSLPGGMNRTETRYLDGQIKRVEATGRLPQEYSYEVKSEGGGYRSSRVKILTAVGGSEKRYREERFDLLGRKLKVIQPGFGNTGTRTDQFEYDPNTGLQKFAQPEGLAKTLLTYDEMGKPKRTTYNADDAPTTDTTDDRITETQEQFVQETASGSAGIWLVKTTQQAVSDTSNSLTPMATVRKRLTGLSMDRRVEIRESDSVNNTVVKTTDVLSGLAVTRIKKPGTSNYRTETSAAGLLLEVTDFDGSVSYCFYDALGRKMADTDARGNSTTYKYHTATNWVNEVYDGKNVCMAKKWYDGAGRVVLVIDALGHTTRTAYTASGEVYRVWGSGTYPVEYQYDPTEGKMSKLITYRDRFGLAVADSTTWPCSALSGDTTEWIFDPATGWLTDKKDAKGKKTSYTYNSRGQIATRTWARNVVTTYTYDPVYVGPPASKTLKTGELYKVDYSGPAGMEPTPSVTYQYNRLGQISSVLDATGNRIIDHCLCGKTAKEAYDATFYASRQLTIKLESDTTGAKMRSETIGYSVGTSSSPAIEVDVGYRYEATTGRFSQILPNELEPENVFEYDYGPVASGSLVRGVKMDSRYRQIYYYETNRDLLSQITTSWNNQAPITSYTYQYNDLRQRSSVVQSGTAFSDYYEPVGQNGTEPQIAVDGIHLLYTYNPRGELTMAGTYLGSDPTSQVNPMSGRIYDYGYDGIGNRKWTNNSGKADLRDEYTTNEINQYVFRENNTLAVGGTAKRASTVIVGVDGTVPAGRAGRHWGDNVLVDNSNQKPYYGPLNIFAYSGSNGNTVANTILNKVMLAPAEQLFSYDNDGNLTGDGVWVYTWDAENRLVRMEPNSYAKDAGMPNKKLEFRYDYLHRRVEKKVTTTVIQSGVTTVTVATTRFLYLGWNLIGEYTVTSDTSNPLVLARSYVWGLDITRTLEGAGGVGALLEIDDRVEMVKFAPAYDGNGNLTALINLAGGTVTAVYEYSPYGEMIRCEGPYAKKNPFRFSTKYIDDETGLYNYGTRYYDPRNGRFISKDPATEKGGINLYGFVGNNPVNDFDVLGMISYRLLRSLNGDEYYMMDPFEVSETRLPSFRFIGGVGNPGGSGGGAGSGSVPGGRNFDPDDQEGNQLPAFEVKVRPCKQPGSISIIGALLGNPLPQFAVPRSAYNDALMAQLAYNVGVTPYPWGEVTPESVGLEKDLFGDFSGVGYSAKIFKNASTGAYTISFRGTDLDKLDVSDLVTDAGQATGLLAGQYRNAVELARAARAKLGPGLSFTGHSLGGGLAAAAAIATGLFANTYNAAGIHGYTASQLGLDLSQGANLVTNYHVLGDPLTSGQMITSLPNAVGKQQYLNPPTAYDIVNAHPVSKVIAAMGSNICED